MSVQIANYIHDGGRGFKGAKSIEIGAAVIEQPGALADWRTSAQNWGGQVAFYYACDHWNVYKVSNGTRLRAKQLVLDHPFPITLATAKRLVAELKVLDSGPTAFLKAVPPEPGC